MTRKAYFAHSSGEVDQRDWHLLGDHLRETGRGAASFLANVGAAELAETAGLLHDLGKYSNRFQQRLEGKTIRVDHSTAGAKVAMERYGPHLGKILAFCIAGHHAGLANGVGSGQTAALVDRLAQAFGPDLPDLDDVWQTEVCLRPSLKPPPLRPGGPGGKAFSIALLTRLVFSALVDADFLDTEAYFAKIEGRPRSRGGHPVLAELKGRLDDYLAGLKRESTEVNRLRQSILLHARQKAALEPGLFSLTVPTGGGKTLSSLAFALEHALAHGLGRVIYVIPFTSIVEQTAAVFRRALGDDGDGFILEHHSAFEDECIARRDGREKLRLAMENWDAPVVVTTAVQFFESLFANRPSRCRKLHNICNSVVILDEAQTLPLPLLRPCVAALDELARNYRTTLVLCTATQPALQAPDFAGGFEAGAVREIAPDPPDLYRRLKRVRFHPPSVLDDSTLAQRLGEVGQVLCIVNTRRHARELFDMIAEAEGARHLTTLMCAKHRSDALAEIRQRLADRLPVRLVATSLVEAGVDLDFPVVYRATAGLDSLAQAAGRCNREGRLDVGDVYVFEPTEADGRKPPAEVAQFAAAARSILRRYDDPLSLDAIKAYFQDVYWLKDDQLDAKNILPLLQERTRSFDFPFETIASLFRVIETPLVPVIVPYAGMGGDRWNGERLIAELQFANSVGRIARQLQPYIVQISPFARRSLIQTHAAEIIRQEDFGEQFVVLRNTDLYDPRMGLSWEDPTMRRAEGLIA